MSTFHFLHLWNCALSILCTFAASIFCTHYMFCTIHILHIPCTLHVLHIPYILHIPYFAHFIFCKFLFHILCIACSKLSRFHFFAHSLSYIFHILHTLFSAHSISNAGLLILTKIFKSFQLNTLYLISLCLTNSCTFIWSCTSIWFTRVSCKFHFCTFHSFYFLHIPISAFHFLHIPFSSHFWIAIFLLCATQTQCWNACCHTTIHPILTQRCCI